MADNISIKDGTGTSRTLRATDNSGVHTTHHIIDRLPQSSATNTPAIATTGGDALTANTSRKRLSIQNVGTNPLFVRFGTGASATVFHIILKGGTADSDGLGGILTDDSWTGVVSVFGTSPKYVVTEWT